MNQTSDIHDEPLRAPAPALALSPTELSNRVFAWYADRGLLEQMPDSSMECLEAYLEAHPLVTVPVGVRDRVRRIVVDEGAAPIPAPIRGMDDERLEALTEMDCCPVCGGTKPEHRGARPEAYGGGLCLNPYHAGHIADGEAEAIAGRLEALHPKPEPIWSETAPTEGGTYAAVTVPRPGGPCDGLGPSPAFAVNVCEDSENGGWLTPCWPSIVEEHLEHFTVLWGPRITLPPAPEKPAPAQKSGSGLSLEMEVALAEERVRGHDEAVRGAFGPGARLVCSDCGGPRAVRPGSCSSDFHGTPTCPQPEDHINYGEHDERGPILVTTDSPADAFSKLSMDDKQAVIEAMKPGDSMEDAMRTLTADEPAEHEFTQSEVERELDALLKATDPMGSLDRRVKP